MKLPHAWSKATPVFDDHRLVSCAGLVPVMALAEQAGLSDLVAERVVIKSSLVASAGVNPAGKVTSIIAGMAAGADSIDDLDLIRSGGMKQLFASVYAPTTLGQFLRSFTHGHVSQLASAARAHLVGLVERTDLLPARSRRSRSASHRSARSANELVGRRTPALGRDGRSRIRSRSRKRAAAAVGP